MRTTLTLDDDVAAKLKERSRRTGRSFKEVVNEVLREGLSAPRKLAPLRPFRVRARPLKTRAGVSIDNIEELLEQIEGPGRA